MKSMVNQIYIPTVPFSESQNQIAIELQAELIARGYSPGLMLVILGGMKGLDQKEKDYAGLKKFQSIIKDWPLVTMLSCTPMKELDLLHETNFGIAHIKEGIDYAADLLFGREKLVTFHLGSLVRKDEFRSRTKENWENQFHRIIRPSLKEIAKYGQEQGVAIKVETTPVPEFGDISDADERIYRGVKFNQLRNPFYSTNHWGFEQIRDTGLGLCLDLCHNRTIYETAKSGEYGGIIFPEDSEVFAGSTLFDDVTALSPSDLVHLNDGRGIYSDSKKTVFEEGVPLGEGDIDSLGQMIDSLDQRDIAYVLEINETDFVKRPNTQKSIDYLLKRE